MHGPSAPATWSLTLRPEWPSSDQSLGYREGVAQDLLRQFGGPLGGDLGQLAATVSDLHDEQAGQPVEDRPVAVVPDVRASLRVTAGP